MRILQLLLATIPPVLIAGQAFGVQEKEHEVRAIYRLGGHSICSYHEVENRNQLGIIETTLDSDMIFNRLGVKLEIKSRTVYREDAEGNLLGLTSDASSSKQITRIDVKGGPKFLSITTTSGDKKYSRQAAVAGKLLGPEGARRLILKQLHAVGDTASYQTFSAEISQLTTITNRVIATGEIKDGGVLKLEQSYAGMPFKSVSWLDSQGWIVDQTTPSPFGDIVAARSSSAEKVSASTVVSLPSEMFTGTTVRSNVRLPDERLIDSVKLGLKLRNTSTGWPDFTAPNQKVLSKTRDLVVLEIIRPRVLSSAPRPAAVTGSFKEYLEPNALFQSDDPTVKSIAAKVVKPGDDAWTAVRALQRWTNDNMHFDLGVAIVSASEVAKYKGGTCFGYSVLLGSLVRAAGVPSRLRMGMVYAGGIWGGHAWVDVLINYRWIPVDSALYSPGPADAARFSVFTSSLQEGVQSNLGGLSQVFGNVDIKILEYAEAGKRIVVPVDAKPYTVIGNTYHNPWIGFSITKQRNFRFTDFNLVWPQSTLVAMQGPNHELIEVQNLSVSLPTASQDELKIFRDAGFRGPITTLRVRKRSFSLTRARGRIATILKNRGRIWLVIASGPKADDALLRAVSTIRWD